MRGRDEQGMTLIEVMVAMTIAAVGIMATVGVLDHSRTLTMRSEAREQAVHEGERELERLNALSWEQLAHTTAPARVNQAGHPASYVIGGPRYQYDHTSTSLSEDFELAGTGLVPSTGSAWTDGQGRRGGFVWRFVTSGLDAAGGNTTAALDVKRVTVVVTLDDDPDFRRSVLLSTLVTRPIVR